MLAIKPLTESFSVAPQPTLEDVSALAQLGFKSVINNRIEHESDDQLTSAAVATACAEHGIEYQHLPVISGKVTATDAEQFEQLLATMPKPILAYCRVGTRCSLLWIGAAKTTQDQAERVAQAHAQGFTFGPDQLAPFIIE